MTMLRNMSAWTAPDVAYPEYVSINRNLAGDVEITVRGGAYDGLPGDTVAITLPALDGRELLREALDAC